MFEPHAEKSGAHILVVEDDESLGRWIVDYLSDQGYLVSLATQGMSALQMIKDDNPALTILDINLPDCTGFDVCRAARKFYSAPILMLTAREDEEDELAGLQAGANDYLIKPIRPRALYLRMQRLLGEEPGETAASITLGSLFVNRQSRQCRLAGEEVMLTTTEFDLLWLMVSNAGKVKSRDEMINELRGLDYDGFDRSVDILVSRLRRKLGDRAGSAHKIKTVRGVGYLLVADAW